jgi:hypothetical protein
MSHSRRNSLSSPSILLLCVAGGGPTITTLMLLPAKKKTARPTKTLHLRFVWGPEASVYR